MNRISVLLAALLLLLMAFLAGGAARRESITCDEVAHIGAGVSYLQKFDLRLNPEHPPLAKVLAALPLVLRGVRADYSDVSWTISGHGFGMMLGEWSWGHALALRWNDPYSTVWWARVPMLLLTLLLGVFVFRYASQLGGPWGGLLCLSAFVSTPAFLVFGPLVLTDVAVAFFVLLTLWSFAELWRAPSRQTLIPFGLLLAGSFLSKFSSGLLLFCFLAFRLSLRYVPLTDVPKDATELRAWRKLRGRYMWKGVLLAAIAVYAVYFILSWNQPTDALSFLGHNTASLILRRLLMPPFDYLRGLFFFAVISSRPTYILGHIYPHGVWFYFPILFLLKSTLAFLLMLALAIPVALFARRKTGTTLIPQDLQFHWRAIWTFLLVFVGACMLSRMDLSIRHFTVPIALFILLLAPLPQALKALLEKGWAGARVGMAAYALLSLLAIVTVVRVYPYYFPFLSSLSFGRPPYALVNDSNVDWNNALVDVERVVQERHLSRVLVDEYGFNDPSVYVPQAQFWNCQQPSAGDAGQLAFVSGGMIKDAHNCLWLFDYPHEAIAGGSMYMVQLPTVLPAAGEPGGPPKPADFHEFGMPMPGVSDSRTIFLNCVLDAQQLQPTMDHMMAHYEEQRKQRQKR